MGWGSGDRMALPGSGRSTPAFKLVCPEGDYAIYVASFSRRSRPKCPVHRIPLELEEEEE